MSGDRDPQASSAPHTPPLKRHAALVPLSREHMSGLVQARNLQHAANGAVDEQTRRRAVEDFVRVWEAEIREHFDDEERLLLPLTSDAAMRERLLREHGEIRKLARRCGVGRGDPVASADAPTMLRLSKLLHDHIRWEEREFFEAVQREHPGALAALEHEAAAIERRRPQSRARSTLAWCERRDDPKEQGP